MLYLQQINSKSQSQEKCFDCDKLFHLKCLVNKIKYAIENIVCRACMAEERLTYEPTIGESEIIFEHVVHFLKP